jgi:hypothetical protein
MKPAALAAVLAALLLPAALPAPVAAQGSGLTLDQVQRKYRKMNEVHIVKCDRNGDGLFTRSEMLCVSSIYQAMYLDRD